jgi:hypothetical protein
MVTSGMTALPAIQAATVTAPEALGRSNDVDAIATGRFGVLIWVAGEPLADVAVLQSVMFGAARWVKQGGAALAARESALSGAAALRADGVLLKFVYEWRLKNCTARSCFSAATRVLKVPRFRRRLVRGSIFREYSRYSPDLSLRIMSLTPARQRLIAPHASS